ncbi:hypothetical protein [Promicromonospora kroppenstedtii]|uniref:hypothetical protein n=1 Tax=Promicromonospora kroppenstedtii TaxID=440482 RepID=UPI00056C1604|nr:hypothetical protein [Promicromonospora kroppenstedtii]
MAAPQVGSFWENVTQDTTPRTGSLGTFGLDASLISGASYVPAWNAFAFIQRVPTGGARVWYMNLSGTFNDLWDLPSDWHVTSGAVGTDGEWRFMLRWEGNDEWYIYDYTQTNRFRQYIRQNTSREPQLAMDGNNVWVVESFSGGPRFYRMDTSTPVGGTTIAETVVSSGTPVGGQLTNSPWTFMRTAADFGSARFIVSYNGTSTFRVYNASGVHQPAETWSPPSSKATGWWDPTTSRFRTLGLDNRAYRHSAMTWTDSALDTWHLAQTFYDGQTSGGTHETVIGGIRTFQPLKRSWVRITPAQVPYTGLADDPNISRIYGKTGAAPPASGSGMWLQESVNYTSAIRDRGTLLVTSGTAPPSVSNFPGATPARMRSARTMPSDSTKSIFEVRGDGSGRLGAAGVRRHGQVYVSVRHRVGGNDGPVGVLRRGGKPAPGAPHRGRRLLQGDGRRDLRDIGQHVPRADPDIGRRPSGGGDLPRRLPLRRQSRRRPSPRT